VLKDIYAPAPFTDRGKPVHVGGDFKNKKDIVYCVGQSVVVRSLENPMKCYFFREHTSQVLVARYSPSGFYIASTDIQGKLKVWDTVNQEHVVTLNKDTIGQYMDMQWSEDSKRIIGGGSGRQSFGEVFLTDSGSGVGQISGHSKSILSVDMKPTRPYRCITGSEDFSVNFYEGPPFKFLKSTRDHSKYVNCVRFSPNGEKAVSVSSDKRGIFYDAKTGDVIGELSTDDGHSSSIYACAWSDDSNSLLTVSADKTAKIWNTSTYKCVKTFTFPDDVNHFQVGCLWQGQFIVTVNLRGDISLLDENNTDRPLRVIHGHSNKITTLAYDKSSHKAYTSDITGFTIEWNLENGRTAPFEGTPHTNNVSKIHIHEGKLLSVAFDDSLKVTPLESREYGPSIPLEGQPIDVKNYGNSIFVLTHDKLLTVTNGSVSNQQELGFVATCFAIHPSGKEIAIGGKDLLIHVYTLNGDKLTKKYDLSGNQGYVTCLDYSPNGQYLGSGDSSRQVKAWEGNAIKEKRWVFHTTFVTSIKWCSDNEHVVTGSVDTNVIVWNLSKPLRRILIEKAHQGGVTDVAWIDVNTIASVGDDCSLKTWSVTHH